MSGPQPLSHPPCSTADDCSLALPAARLAWPPRPFPHHLAPAAPTYLPPTQPAAKLTLLLPPRYPSARFFDDEAGPLPHLASEKVRASSACAHALALTCSSPARAVRQTMSWTPRSRADADRRHPAGYTSSVSTFQPLDQEARSERLRLPPLSTLISGTPPLGPPSSHTSPTASTRPEWSPLTGSSGSTTFATTTSRPELLAHHSSVEAVNTLHQPLTYRQPQQPPRQVPPVLPRSVSPPYHSATSLPPLTALSICKSPSIPSSLYGKAREVYPPQLPPTSSSSATVFSSPRRHSRDAGSPSSSSRAGLGPTRRRWTGGATSSRPYQRPSPPTDPEYFGHVSLRRESWADACPDCLVSVQLWDIYSYACRANEGFLPSPRAYPSIAEGDTRTMLHYLHRELDQLDQRDRRLSLQLAQDAGLSKERLHASAQPLFQRSHPSDLDAYHYLGGMARKDQGDGRARSDEMDMSSLSSPTDSLTSPSSHYLSSGLPGIRAPQRRRKSTATSSTPTSATATSTPPASLTSPLSAHLSTSTSAPSASMPPKRVRKRKDEADQSCLSCSATETPEWRKGPTGPRTLCNACGLLFAKQSRKRESDAQSRGERPRGARPLAPEAMSAEERQRSLTELKIAVNARSNASPPI